jgi:hypothetical protein
VISIDHFLNTRQESEAGKLLKSGAPGEIRTPDLLLRRQSLYPAELRARAGDSISLHADTQGINRGAFGKNSLGRDCE